MKALKAAGPEAVKLPFYCGPFMGEEQMLAQALWPRGEFHVVMPWATGIDNPAQASFIEIIQKEKNKQANIFHLLGWEAGIVAAQIVKNDIGSLKGWSYDSPRGLVTIHPDTQHTYAPLYETTIEGNEQGNCKVIVREMINISAEEHQRVLADKPEGMVSGWKNNYLCI
jgi:branched-chain amino acid transport system substrate-binding protein